MPRLPSKPSAPLIHDPPWAYALKAAVLALGLAATLSAEPTVAPQAWSPDRTAGAGLAPAETIEVVAEGPFGESLVIAPPAPADPGPPPAFALPVGTLSDPVFSGLWNVRDGWRPWTADPLRPDWYRLDGNVRAYYVNDQRIEWSGQEATFGAEAALMPVYRRQLDFCELTVLGEFYLNQPFDRNILADTPERRSYLANFEIDPFQISQLQIRLRRGDWELAVGKMATPFGRTYFRLFSNAKWDAPFIRSEAIRWRELGVLLRWAPEWLVCEVAMTNGCDDADTNSSKALVSRVGFQTQRLAGGVSLKVQDGIGSEHHKQFNNHVGADLACRWGVFTLSGEVILDQYGFTRPGFDPNEIFWGRSIYYRDLNKAKDQSIQGVGYYVNLGFAWERWGGDLNYGEYYPEQLGDPRHDTVNRRGLVKLDYELADRLETYGVLLVENDLPDAQAGRLRYGLGVLGGFLYTF